MKNNIGFTLVELMVVVAIMSILAAIAYPSYTDSVTKGHRTQAMAALMAFNQTMEHFQINNGTYVGAADSNKKPLIFSNKSPLDGPEKHYELTVETADGTSFTLKAKAVGGQAGDGDLTLASTGIRSWAGNACWPPNC